MASRLAESFDLPKLDKITAGLEDVYERFAREGRDRLQVQELMTAVEHLIKQLPAEVRDRGAVNRAEVQGAIMAVARVHGRTEGHEPGDQK